MLVHSLPWTKVRQVYRLLGLVRRPGVKAALRERECSGGWRMSV
ncbi:hypothetical protein [Mycobacterium haemophilum]|nr:hypothetical protein [Mycobacterium haemophilum]